MRSGKSIPSITAQHHVEEAYYGRHWPSKPEPYVHLEPYLKGWMDPEVVFRGKRVLDIGAGECTYTRLIADRFGPTRIIACELFRERMLPAWRDNRNRRLKVVSGDCFYLPFGSGTFDVVFGSLVLSQLPQLDQVIAEIRRVLICGGLYVGIEPNPFNPVILYRYFAKPHSANQYLFWPSKFHPMFSASGFAIHTRYFYARLPWARIPLLGTCIGVLATRRESQ
jgi:ubiquinone/menaquinone biosynthesis C-methylase UbiE